MVKGLRGDGYAGHHVTLVPNLTGSSSWSQLGISGRSCMVCYKGYICYRPSEESNSRACAKNAGALSMESLLLKG